MSEGMDIGGDSVEYKVTHDPGWNDPPLFSYDAVHAAGQSAKKGALLNKRVAYPLSSKTPKTVDKEGPGLLPMPPIGPITVPPVISSVRNEPGSDETNTASNPEEPVTIDKQEMLANVMTTFDDLLNALSEESERSKEEIRKRLYVLKKMWEEDKLNPDVHKKLYRLSEALKEGNVKLADNIQAGLMVDHVTLCRSWMAALRKLILQVKLTTPATPLRSAGDETELLAS